MQAIGDRQLIPAGEIVLLRLSSVRESRRRGMAHEGFKRQLDSMGQQRVLWPELFPVSIVSHRERSEAKLTRPMQVLRGRGIRFDRGIDWRSHHVSLAAAALDTLRALRYRPPKSSPPILFQALRWQSAHRFPSVPARRLEFVKDLSTMDNSF